MIITRHGGLGGVALRKEEYHKLLNDLGIFIRVVTGRQKTCFGPISPLGQRRTVIPRLDLLHPDSLRLYAGGFRHGSEASGAEVLSDDDRMALFRHHKRRIRATVNEMLRKIPGDTPVFVYKLLSLRHLHPAAAVALRELVESHPRRAFVSHSADPDSERPERISRLKGFVRDLISARPPGELYSGGPYRYPNLFHIVLNPTQQATFRASWTTWPVLRWSRAMTGTAPPPKRSAGRRFFPSPVRPVARKPLREAMVAAHHYGLSRGRRICFGVTHRTSTTGPVSGRRCASPGGWENALNEMAAAGIPFFMNRRLNSYGPLTQRIDMRCHGMDFTVLEKVVAGGSTGESARRSLVHVPAVAALFEWIDGVLSPQRRERVVRHNYERAYRYLSSHATALKLWRLVWATYARMSLR